MDDWWRISACWRRSWRAGTFARAADALGLSPSGVSRAVARLEASIGVRLLDRTTRSVALTDEGRRLYGEIGPLLSGIENAFTHTAGSSRVVRGRLRVNVDAFFSRMMLAAHTGRFLARYPEISLDLIARDHLGDLVGEGFDIAIRFGQPPDSSLVARKLLETRTVTVASPAYLRKHGQPTKPADLADHQCIQVRNTLTGELLGDWEYRRDRKSEAVKTQGRLQVTEFGTMLGACLAGVGVARIKEIGIRDLLEKGRLIELLPGGMARRSPSTRSTLEPSPGGETARLYRLCRGHHRRRPCLFRRRENTESI